MAIKKNTNDLLSQAATTLADNSTQDITPQDVREMAENNAFSSYNKITDNNLVGLKNYSTAATYEAAQGVVYNGSIYISNTIPTPGAFNPSEWDILLGGEVNTSSNSGTGEGLALAKSGSNLPFKSLTAGTGITLTSAANELQISSAGGNSIYSADGTLLANRVIDSNGNTLLISNGSKSVGVDSWSVHTYWSLNNGSNAWTLLSANASGTFNQDEFGISFNGGSTVPFRIFGGDKIALGNVSKANLDTNYSVNVKNGLIIQDGNFKHEGGIFTIETKANQEIRTSNNIYPSFYFDNNTTNYQIGNADSSSGTFNEGDFFIYNASTVKTNLLITKTGQTIISNGATSVIGSEKISLQNDTLIKGSDNAEATSGLKVTDINNDLLFDIRNNGQIGYGGIYRNLYAHTFRNPNNEARIASFDDDTAGTESFIIQTNGRFYSEQSGQTVFSSYRQAGQSFAKVYDAGVESIRLGKQGSFINGALRVGGPSGSTTGTVGARFEIGQQSTNTFQQLFFANARVVTLGRINSSGSYNTDQKGLECYDTDVNKKYFWNGSAWEKIKGNIESVSQATATTLTPNIDVSAMEILSSLAAALTIAAPTGTPHEGQELTFRFKDDGTARALTWNAIFEDYTGSLPTTTTAGKTVYIGCKYNLINTKWDVLAVQTQP